MVRLVLYTTSACHLCEQAQRVIYAALQGAAAGVTESDIVDDDRLFERYSLRIPVLRRTDNGTELDWPFTPEDVLALVQA